MDMLAATGLPITVAVAGTSIAIGIACDVAAAQNPIANAQDVRAALQACWMAPGDAAPRQISVRFSFNRDGEIVGQPFITYENPQPSEEGRAAVRNAVAEALSRCTPLHLSDDFRKVISVHPIAVRFGGGWQRRGQPAAHSP